MKVYELQEYLEDAYPDSEVVVVNDNNDGDPEYPVIDVDDLGDTFVIIIGA